jgi:ATP/maltotriose-dependent transcriptional regulator MalT
VGQADGVSGPSAGARPLRLAGRERLVALLRPGRVGILEAGAVYGKSTLAGELGDRLAVSCATVSLSPADDEESVLVSSVRRALRVARLSDLAAAIDAQNPAIAVDRLVDALIATEDPVLLVFADAHHLRSDGPAALILRLARALPPPHRVVLTGRRLPACLEALRSTPEAVCPGTDQLAFTHGEAEELIAGRLGRRPPVSVVRMLVAASHGWATALVLAAAAISNADDPEAVVRRLSAAREVTHRSCATCSRTSERGSATA